MTNDKIIDRVVQSLDSVDGIAAVVLGGSRARGTATPTSDYDIGLYIESADRLDLDHLRRAVDDLADQGSDYTVTSVGEWGRWVVGGAWLVVEGNRVDFLYRPLVDLSRTIDECSAGRLVVDYQPGHPHCFVSSIWMAELAYCRVLSDKTGDLTRLKSTAAEYPPGLQRATLARFGWEARFSLDNAHKAIARADLTYVAGCLFRSFACLGQVIHALNRVYLMNEKGALRLSAAMPLTVPDLLGRVGRVWGLLGEGRLEECLSVAGAIVEDAEQLLSAASVS